MSTLKRIKERESSDLEFKSSLFFQSGILTPGAGQVERTIMKVIASFMNQEGGTLYIGVHDHGYPVKSIEDEYCYLNLFPAFEDTTYPQNQDGYSRFIMDWIARTLTNYACSLVKIFFDTIDGFTVCRIEVKKSRTPVWHNGVNLYVRTDSSSRQLKGNDIFSFIRQIDPEEIKQNINDEAEKARLRKEEILTKETSRMDSLLVIFPDGTFIHEPKTVRTFWRALHVIGLTEVKDLEIAGRQGKGATPYIPLVGTMVYDDKQKTLKALNDGNYINGQRLGNTQVYLDGYCVFVKYENSHFQQILEQVSRELGLKLDIEFY